MSLLQARPGKTVSLELALDLVRNVKRGHPWIYPEALKSRPRAPIGSIATLSHKRLAPDAVGYYDPSSPIVLRICSVDGEALDQAWAERRLKTALALRARLFPGGETTGYRLLNGEGDGVPGLVVDRYADTAVLQLDGLGPAAFWDKAGVAAFLAAELGLARVVYKPRKGEPEALVGAPPEGEIEFVEHGVRFRADVVRGQKTGFFFDQRENRAAVRAFASGRSVLNLFSYTGGFSVYAGLGGASEVTSVDIAAPAVEAAARNWELNGLDPDAHRVEAADAFEFLAGAGGRTWDLVVVDPPSFAPSRAALERARSAYEKLFGAAARAVSPGGALALASCSSHLDEAAFLELAQKGVSAAGRRAVVLTLKGQGADHPYPLACPELRYLKFALMGLD